MWGVCQVLKDKKILVLLISFLLVLTACSQAGEDDPRDLADQPYERQEFLLGTLVDISVYDQGQEEALDKAVDRVEELDGIFSMTNPDSEVYAINESSGQEPVQVSDEVYYVIENALDYAEISGGRMDPTIGALTDIWGIGQEDAQVPSQEEIDQALPLVNYENVELDEEAKTVYLTQEGMKLDLGAIAKGYITDQAKDVLVEEGVTTAIVDLGGDIFLLGSSSRGSQDNWRIGIQNPFDERGEIVGLLPVMDEAVVTSGIYERLITGEDGQEYHHILDPETGYPFDNELAGLSVAAETTMDADALATVLFSMGLDQGMDYASSLEDVTAVFITHDQEIYVSEGDASEFELLDESFDFKGDSLD